MVRVILVSLLVLLSGLINANVEISAEIDEFAATPNMPLKGTVVVKHPKDQHVDTSSFKLGGASLDVSLLNEVSHSSVSIINGVRSEEKGAISTYTFVTDGQPAGLHTLPPISIDVGDKTYYSAATTYEIAKSSASQKDFSLEAFCDGPTTCYPGQKLKLCYRIRYKDDVEITSQDMPLLEHYGLKAVGERHFRRYYKSGYEVQEITQEVETISPGIFTYGPSMMEGFFFTEDFFGRRQYRKPKIRAEASPVNIVVEQFPSGMPSSFNGAIGEFTLDVKMLTPPKVWVGDKVQLAVTVRGSGNLDTVKLPEISLQNAFSENFRFSDLPPISTVDGTAKTFTVELRPISAVVHEVPEIAFSFFEPMTKQYKTRTSDPIPLVVIPVVIPVEKKQYVDSHQPDQEDVLEEIVDEIDSSWRDTLYVPQPINISSNYALNHDELEAGYYYRGSSFFYFVPIAVLLLAIQEGLRRLFRFKRKSRNQHDSKYYYETALKNTKDVALFCFYLEKALLSALYEKHNIDNKNITVASLSQEGMSGKVKVLLEDIAARRFAGEESLVVTDVLDKAKFLYLEIQGENNV